VGVTHHPVLWSPDFPPGATGEGCARAAVRSAPNLPVPYARRGPFDSAGPNQADWEYWGGVLSRPAAGPIRIGERTYSADLVRSGEIRFTNSSGCNDLTHCWVVAGGSGPNGYSTSPLASPCHFPPPRRAARRVGASPVECVHRVSSHDFRLAPLRASPSDLANGHAFAGLRRDGQPVRQFIACGHATCGTADRDQLRFRPAPGRAFARGELATQFAASAAGRDSARPDSADPVQVVRCGADLGHPSRASRNASAA